MSGTYVLRGKQKYQFVNSKIFNIDNGSGQTDDSILFSGLPYSIMIEDVKAVYTQATDTAGAASANFKVGTSAAGGENVAATALEVPKAIGSTTSATITKKLVPAGSTLYVRHTGVDSTEVGEYFVQITYRILA